MSDALGRSASSAVICVGGGGRRLGGVPKWLIELNGEPLLVRSLLLAAALSDEVVLLAGPEGECLWDEPRVRARTARLLAEVSERSGVRARVWREPGQGQGQGAAGRSGPLTALCAALALAPRPWLWVLACDAPLLTPALLAPLAQRLTPHTLASLYTTPSAHRGEGGATPSASREALAVSVHPLAGLWSREASPWARAQLNGGSLRRLCAHERVRLTPAPTPALLLNLNTPADLALDPLAPPSSRLHFTLPLLS